MDASDGGEPALSPTSLEITRCLQALTEGYVIEETEQTRQADRRTPAERRHDAYLEVNRRRPT